MSMRIMTSIQLPGRLHPAQVMQVPLPSAIFVFGSNAAGRHGKGAALTALRLYGAKYGQGQGLQGRSYAIPTKTAHLSRLPIGVIKANIDQFIRYARENTDMTFYITPVGCGLSGYPREVIWPLFDECSWLGSQGNVVVDEVDAFRRRIYFAASWLDD